MPKHKRLGKASIKTPFSHDLFLQALFRDLGSSELVREAQLVWLNDPASLLDHVSQSALSTESSIGGGEDYVALRQIGALLKKNTDWFAKSTADRRNGAMDKFRESERVCSRTNKRLRHYSKHWSRAPFAQEVLANAALLVQGILGPLHEAAIEEIFDGCRHGSGLTFDATDPEHRNLYHKLSRPGSVTEKALPYLRRYALTSDQYGFDLLALDKVPSIVRGNRVTSVPKTAQIDRTIAIEPAFNVFLQKGVDTYMRKLLRRVGIRLRDQDYSHPLALEGSIGGNLATVDLSSASDSVSIELVRLLLPPDWFALLDDLRSHEFLCDGEWKEYTKFSSMGNAFTFPLESLVFYAIAKSCMSYTGADIGKLRVYGDDIVVPTDTYGLLVEVLSYAGFQVNTDKSYPFGFFRETCGHDYLSGMNVRPVYLTRWPRTVTEVYSLHNRLLTIAKVPLPRVLDYLASLVQRPHRGPMYLLSSGKPWRISENIRHDSYLITDPPVGSSVYDPNLQCLVWKSDIVSPIPKSLIVRSERAAYLAFLLGVPKGEIKSAINIPIRQRTVSFTHWPTVREGLRLLRGDLIGIVNETN